VAILTINIELLNLQKENNMKAFKQFRSTKALRNFTDKHRRTHKQLWRERTRGVNYGE
jgi:hypothetical protein